MALDARHFVLDAQSFAMGIRDHEYPDILLAHRPQKILGARQVADAVVLVAVSLSDIDVQVVTPVIQAIPFDLAAHRVELGVQLLTCRGWLKAVLGSKVLRDMVHPHVIVVGKIEHRAVHVQHQGFAFEQRGFGIDFHCFILRAGLKCKGN